MKIRIGVIVLAIAAIVAPLRSTAEDIDLFVGRSTAATDAPNVLIILDNTANWGPQAKFQSQKNALVSVLNSLVDPVDPTHAKVNLGLMLFTETGNGNSGNDGGYVRSAIRPLDATYLAAFKKLLVGTSGTAGLDVTADKSNSGKAGLTMAEAYLYYLGGNATTWERPWAGNNKNKTDYFGNIYGSSADAKAVYLLSGNALNARASTQYISPLVPGSCAKNYIIYIGNGPAQDSSADSTAASNILKNMVGAPASLTSTDLNITPSGSKTNKADEWASYMNNNAPVRVSTFALDVNIVNNLGQCTNTANGGWSALLKNMSKTVGGGEYYPLCATAFDQSKFTFDLKDAFNRILSRNSVFASVALPVAANMQSTYLNQVFIGMFRPDANALPRWWGNLKQYHLAISSNELKMVDADGADLIDTSNTANGGFIKGCARSFWTPTSETSPYYWDYLSNTANCSGQPAGSNTPDGQIVEKGGQAYTLRASTPASRVVKTCNPTLATCNSTGLVAFSDANIPANALGEANAADRTSLINWTIGSDVLDENGNLNVAQMRPSIHGDIVHSQPVAIDYAGNPSNPDVVVFYGGNDGMLRAINGDQTGTQGTVTAGYEFWAFMPPEFYSHIKRLRDNTASIQFPASGPTAGQGVAGTPKDYGMDGPLSAYEFDTNNDNVVDKRTLFAGLRRACRMIYSFNVTSKTTPTLNWKIGCPNLANDTGCTTGMTSLGQTWSRISLMYAQGYDTNSDGNPDPLIVTGGGYDNCEDVDNGSTANNSCSVTKGNRIYVLDAGTGSLVKSFSTDRAVPGDVTVVTVSDTNRKAKFIYAVDTGGNVYRISGGTQSPYAPAAIGSTDPSTWFITKIASLGCDTLAACNPNRKFLFGPDVVRIPDKSDEFGILVGSGDREKPLTDYAATYAVNNYFYSLVDEPTNASWLDDAPNPNQLCGGNSIICQNALTTVATGDSFDPNLVIAKKGWKLPLRAGEQVVTGAITVDSVVNFSTHIPAVPDSCDAEYGEATAYNVDYSNAKGGTTQFIGGGLVPTPVAGKVLIDGVLVPFCIGCGSEGSPIGAGKVGGGINWTQPRSRVFWNIDQVP